MKAFLILSLLYINILAKELTPVVFASDFTYELARIKKDPTFRGLKEFIAILRRS